MYRAGAIGTQLATPVVRFEEIFLSNEIWHSFEEGETLYALIWRQTDDKVYDAVAGSDTFDVYRDADIDDYDVALTNIHGDTNKIKTI